MVRPKMRLADPADLPGHRFAAIWHDSYMYVVGWLSVASVGLRLVSPRPAFSVIRFNARSWAGWENEMGVCGPFPTSRHCAALTLRTPGPTQHIMTATHNGFVLSTTISVSDMSAESQNESKASRPTECVAVHCLATHPETCNTNLVSPNLSRPSIRFGKASKWVQTGNCPSAARFAALRTSTVFQLPTADSNDPQVLQDISHTAHAD